MRPPATCSTQANAEAGLCGSARIGTFDAEAVSIGSSAYRKQVPLNSLTAASVKQVRSHLLMAKHVRSCDLPPHVQRWDPLICAGRIGSPHGQGGNRAWSTESTSVQGAVSMRHAQTRHVLLTVQHQRLGASIEGPLAASNRRTTGGAGSSAVGRYAELCMATLSRRPREAALRRDTRPRAWLALGRPGNLQFSMLHRMRPADPS